MMTVLVIIGLMSSAVILTLPENKSQLELQSTALLRDVNIMAQSSLISGVPTALGLSKDGYAIMRFENGEWASKPGTEFANGIQPEFSGEVSEIKLSDKVLPLVLFEPNGLSTPFTLTLSDGQSVSVFESIGDGRVIRSGGS
jgi:hypothetical protein